MQNKFSIIILNWNNYSDTKACIDSVFRSDQDAKIILVDNGSANEEQKKLKSLASDVNSEKLILNKQNLGFTKAHNQILKNMLKDKDYVMLLNNDSVVDEKLFSVLENRIENHKVDVLSCRMVDYWDKDKMDSAGHKMFSSWEIIPIGHGKNIEKYDKPFRNIGACAGAGLYSTKMLEDIGLFDEYFETGYEDAELGLRAFIAGYNCIYEPRAIVYHKMSSSIKKVFNYDFALKTQCNILYTALKILHWQVITIQIIPWFIRLIILSLVSLLCFRIKIIRFQFHALFIILFRDWNKVIKARKESRRLRRISWWKLLIKQEFFLKRDLINFYRVILKGERSYFEKY